MSMNLRGGGLRGSRLRNHEDVNPLASVANLADVMLVFACGLLTALVSFWNVNVAQNNPNMQGASMEKIDAPDNLPSELKDAGSAYVEKGTVYQDPSTGQYYLLTQDGDMANGDGTSSGGSGSGAQTGSGSQGGSSTGSTAPAPSGSTAPAPSSGGSSTGSSAAAPSRSAGAD